MIIHDNILSEAKKTTSDYNDGYNYYYAEYFLVDPRVKGKT